MEIFSNKNNKEHKIIKKELCYIMYDVMNFNVKIIKKSNKIHNNFSINLA